MRAPIGKNPDFSVFVGELIRTSRGMVGGSWLFGYLAFALSLPFAVAFNKLLECLTLLVRVITLFMSEVW